jgi:hypothetical protein
MAYHNNPKITTDSLICCIDLKDPKCYSGSGSTITDRSGNGNNFTINGATFNPNGYLNFVNNNGDYIVCDADLIGGLDAVSFDMWIRIDSVISGSFIPFVSYATSSDSNEFLFALRNGSNDEVSIAMLGASAVNLNVSSDIWNFDNWINIVLTRDGTVAKFYLDGEIIGTFPSVASGTIDSGGTFLLGQEQDSVEGGFVTDQDFAGDISIFRCYDTSLSDEQILNNFNAHKSRFNL